MTKALKVMTFNIQQLPWLARKISSLPIAGSPGGAPDPDPLGRARQVARAILDMPPRGQPVVVAFNEAFSEDARPELLRLLKPKFPHVIKKLEHPKADVEEDSGLMLFSKLPFLPLPTGGNHVYKAFADAAGSDSKAAKGVGIVRVSGPYDPTTIAFTHLQASYDAANTEHAEIRRKQLDFVRQMLLDLAGGRLQDYANAVIVGDLNIKGDPDDTSGERNLVFSKATATFGTDFEDAWRASMHPPGDGTDDDPGYTHRDTPTLQPNRFDYQCTHRGANNDIGLIAQQMSVPLRLPSEVSDHWALQAHLHRMSPNASPALALDLLALDPVNKGVPESAVWKLSTQMRDEDMLHWIYISKPGTFSIWTDPALEAAAFRRTDFSHALAPADTLNVAELPGSLQALVGGRGHQVEQRGSVFSWREPFFLRLRGVKTSFSGAAPYSIVRHAGESKATALLLHPHLDVDPGLPPSGQKLGTDDKCWLRATQLPKFTGGDYIDRFYLKNPGLVGASLEEIDPPPPVRNNASGKDARLDLTRAGQPADVYLVLQRADVADVHFMVFWDSPLTFVRLDESFRLHVDDETGPDWWGSDEFDLEIDVDGDNVFADSWDDADAGEDWPGLAGAVRASAQSRQGQGDWVAFTEGIGFSALKTDGISAHGSSAGVIAALDPLDKTVETRTATIPVSDPESDGQLTATAVLSKFAPV